MNIRTILKQFLTILPTAVLTSAIMIGYNTFHDSSVHDMVLLGLAQYEEKASVERQAEINRLESIIRANADAVGRVSARLNDVEFTTQRRYDLLTDRLALEKLPPQHR